MQTLTTILVTQLLWGVCHLRLLFPRQVDQSAANTGHPNNINQTLLMECPLDQAFVRFTSIYDEYVNDRSWTFYCRHVIGRLDDCEWSGYINEWQEPVIYKCADNGVISGIHSIHSSESRDRRWSYRCCYLRNGNFANCYITGYLNNLGGAIMGAPDFPYDSSPHIVGAFSFYNHSRMDRRWKAELCSITYRMMP